MTRAVESVNIEVNSLMSLGYCGVALPPPVTPAAKPSALPTTPTALAICARLARAARVKNFMVNVESNRE
jgi:hypothetical protein